MKNYKITVNGNTYDVSVEDVGGSPEIKSVQAAPKAAPAPVAAPAPAAAAAPAPKASAPAGASDVVAPIAGVVLSILVKEGDKVESGQTLLMFEAMKMENELVAQCAGTVKKINVKVGDSMETGAVIVSLA